MPNCIQTNTFVRCPHFGFCGGCSKQDLSYDDQIRLKEEKVRSFLRDVPVERSHPILPSPDILFYRNKMEYSFGDERDRRILKISAENETPSVHLGLHPKGRFALVTPTSECLLLSKESRKILAIVSEWATSHHIPTYLRKNNSGVLRHLVIREGKNTGERMVNLFTTSGLSEADSLAERLKSSGVPITTFIWSLHDGLSDVARSEAPRVLWGDGFIKEKMGRVTLRVLPQTFLQTNTHAAEMMLELLSSWSKEDSAGSSATLFDLYCGSGSIGLNMASGVHDVIGIETEPSAIQDAKLNAEANGVSRATFLLGKVEDHLDVFTRDGVSAGTVATGTVSTGTVVVDPPRMGLHANVVQALLSVAPPHLYYVSCNPETLARDLTLLGPRYPVRDLQPMDFFPHTDHVETAVRLSRR